MISRRQVLKSLIASVGAIAAAGIGYALAVEPMFAPRITRYRLRPARWPDGLDLTIAVLSDIHACRPWMSPERVGSIVDTANGLGADLTVLLGDFVYGHRFVSDPLQPGEWSRELGRLRAPLGVHAVLGNHDWWKDEDVQRRGEGVPFAKRALHDAGIAVYENESVRLQKGGAAFWLAGLGDQLAFSRRQHPGRRIGLDDLPGTLAKVTDAAPIILLAHEPDIMVDVPERVSLVLSGHTHGGQIRLFGWAPVVPSRYGTRYLYGHIRERTDLIVTSGLGCAGVPFRLGVPPEIALVTLSGAA
jgi:predicted MPP superfamily phosphohydrolase